MSSLIVVSPAHRVGGLTHSHLLIRASGRNDWNMVIGNVNLGEVLLSTQILALKDSFQGSRAVATVGRGCFWKRNLTPGL